MIIKATRLQAWTPSGEGGGKSRPLPPPPLDKKRSSLAILGAFLLLFLHMGAFLLRFSHFWGSFYHVGPFCYFSLHGGGLFWSLPPLRKFLRAPMIARRVREHAPRNFLCDHNLVSSGHVLLRFCLKNDKNNDIYIVVMYLLGGFEML